MKKLRKDSLNQSKKKNDIPERIKGRRNNHWKQGRKKE